jgi:hypothetical protein
VKEDRLVIIERVYDLQFDEVKTDAGHCEVPFDQPGVIAEVVERCRTRAKFVGPEDLVFANRAGKPIDRHNLLNRQVEAVARTIDAVFCQLEPPIGVPGLGRCPKLKRWSERGFEPPTPWSRTIAVQTPSALSGVA